MLKPRNHVVNKRCPNCRHKFVVPWKQRKAKFCGHSCAAIFHKAGPKRLKQMHEGARRKADEVRGTGKDTSYVKRNGRHEHRTVAEQKIGRKLLPGEVVHHKDHNRKNNKQRNLEVVPTRADHMNMHRADLEAGKRRKRK